MYDFSALRKRQETESKSFPLSHLLYIYEISSSKDTYINYFEGLQLLIDWLSPIELPKEISRINKLHNTYEIQQIATLLNTWSSSNIQTLI